MIISYLLIIFIADLIYCDVVRGKRRLYNNTQLNTLSNVLLILYMPWELIYSFDVPELD